jgi:Lipid A 3-O-deacylase (PagL)
LSASLGARFQHISNGGRNDINPGIDAFGPTLGLGWSW